MEVLLIPGNNGATTHPLTASMVSRSGNTKSRSWLQQILQCLAVTGFALASYFFISHYLFQTVQVVGVSMAPTLHDSDRYFVNRWVYHLRAPQRGDIVVLKDPTDGAYCVKRVIGLAGESLFFKNGHIYVNGHKLHETYLSPGTRTFVCERKQEELVTCGQDRYFVLADNRNNSLDSRVYGPVPRQNILGVVALSSFSYLNPR